MLFSVSRSREMQEFEVGGESMKRRGLCDESAEMGVLQSVFSSL